MLICLKGADRFKKISTRQKFMISRSLDIKNKLIKTKNLNLGWFVRSCQVFLDEFSHSLPIHLRVHRRYGSLIRFETHQPVLELLTIVVFLQNINQTNIIQPTPIRASHRTLHITKQPTLQT